jgi:hypothetical protein
MGRFYRKWGELPIADCRLPIEKLEKSSHAAKTFGVSKAEKLNGPAAFRWRKWIPAYAGMTPLAVSRE